MQTINTRNLATSYVLLAETVTSDDDGQTVDGSHGIMDADDTYVPMDGIVGPAARLLLDGAHAETAGIVGFDWEPEALAESLVGAIDYADWREGEVIFYAADLPAVGDDEPYVRAVVVRFAPRA